VEQASAVSRASFSPSKMGVIAGACALLAAQRRLKAFLHEVLADPSHHGQVGVERLDDPAVTPALAMAASIGLEQDPGFQDPLGWAFSFVGQPLQMIAFCFTQFDDVFLYRDVLGGHGLRSG
jgi:hypothetical protein